MYLQATVTMLENYFNVSRTLGLRESALKSLISPRDTVAEKIILDVFL